jgi:toxin ParE1/3/4
MNYFFHQQALGEYLAQITYYESQQRGLGARFLHVFDAAMAKIQFAPLSFKIAFAPDVHEYKMAGFPYSILYRQVGDELEVLALAAHRCRPNYWRSRL